MSACPRLAERVKPEQLLVALGTPGLIEMIGESSITQASATRTGYVDGVQETWEVRRPYPPGHQPRQRPSAWRAHPDGRGGRRLGRPGVDRQALPERPIDGLASSERTVIADVREPMEWATDYSPGAMLISLGDVQTRFDAIPTDKEVVFICQPASAVPPPRSSCRESATPTSHTRRKGWPRCAGPTQLSNIQNQYRVMYDVVDTDRVVLVLSIVDRADLARWLRSR